MADNVKINLDVNYKTVIDTEKAVDRLRNKMSDLGSKQTNVKVNMSDEEVRAAHGLPTQAESNRARSRARTENERFWVEQAAAANQTSQTSPTSPQPSSNGGAGAASGGWFRTLIGKAGRLATIGAGLAGVGFGVSRLHQGMQLHRDIAMSEMMLQARGGNTDRGSFLGFGPAEVAQSKLSLAQQTGWQGSTLDSQSRTSLAFARATGQSSAEATNSWMGEFKKVGVNTGSQAKLLANIYDLQKKGVAPTEALMGDTRRVLSAVQGTVGAVTLANGALNAQRAMLGMMGQTGIGQNAATLFSKMQQGLSTGGTTFASQTLAYAALGAFNGKMTPERYWDIQKKMREGWNNPEYVTALRGYINRTGTTRERRAGIVQQFMSGGTEKEAEKVLDFLNDPNGYDKALALGHGKNFLKGVKETGMEGILGAANKLMGTDGGSLLEKEAKEQSQKIKEGAVTNALVTPLNNAFNTFMGRLYDGGFKELIPALKELVKTMGPLGVTLAALSPLMAASALSSIPGLGGGPAGRQLATRLGKAGLLMSAGAVGYELGSIVESFVRDKFGWGVSDLPSNDSVDAAKQRRLYLEKQPNYKGRFDKFGIPFPEDVRRQSMDMGEKGPITVSLDEASRHGIGNYSAFTSVLKAAY